MQVTQIFMDQQTSIAKDLQSVKSLTKPEFNQLCKRVGLQLHHFTKISTLFEIEFGMNMLSYERELEVIRIALDGEMDLKEHFQSKLAIAQDKALFYILNKAFW